MCWGRLQIELIAFVLMQASKGAHNLCVDADCKGGSYSLCSGRLKMGLVTFMLIQAAMGARNLYDDAGYKVGS